MPSHKDLTVQERKFVNEYLENGGHASKAYVAAKFPEKKTRNSLDVCACQLLKKPKIAMALEERLIELDRASEIRVETKRLALWDIAQDGMQKMPMEVSENKPAMEKMVDSKTSVSAISELNKMDGHHAGQSLYIRSEQFVFGQSFAGDVVEGEVLDEESPSE
ncbi:MAG: terminase small subunit [Endozoicomonas sp.]